MLLWKYIEKKKSNMSEKISGAENSAFETSEDLNEVEGGENFKINQRKPNGENYILTPVSHNTIENSPNNIDGMEIDNIPRKSHKKTKYEIASIIIGHLIVITYLSYVTYFYISTRDTCTNDCSLTLCSPYGMLLLTCGATYLGLLYFKLIKSRFGHKIEGSIFKPSRHAIRSAFKTVSSRIVLSIILSAAFFVYIIYETFSDFTRLRALLGIAIFLLLGFLISASPKRINWRPVVCGAIFQFILGVIFIRWPVGRSIFECFGNKVAQFLSFGKEGAAFLFGDYLVWERDIFAFAVLPIIFFFSLCISVLYYLGAMQWILIKLGWILQSILGTTVCESVNAAGNIFLGMTESPLIIRPYIKQLTHSEIHAIMTCGFATVSGTVLAAYISFGAKPAHLITASVMGAPASLLFAKLVYPETEESNTSSNNIQMEKSPDTSILDAASNGASQAINVILNIIANLVAFVAFFAFADGIIKWLTTLMGFEQVDIQFLLGKVFMPISWIIGVDWEDCEAVGNIIGTKTIVNEFVAFNLLGKYKRENKISLRSSAIATFAICSFANPASIGIMIGVLSGLCPERRPSITKVALRALFAACFVTMCTASIAGLLMTDDMIEGI